MNLVSSAGKALCGRVSETGVDHLQGLSYRCLQKDFDYISRIYFRPKHYCRYRQRTRKGIKKSTSRRIAVMEDRVRIPQLLGATPLTTSRLSAATPVKPYKSTKFKSRDVDAKNNLHFHAQCYRRSEVLRPSDLRVDLRSE